jgi:UDP-N-acetylmuramoyl-tripeptide--D-alanyl-D-alanine ligase
MTLDLQDVAAAIATGTAVPQATVAGWSVDSRTIRRDELFFALRGPSHDGHAYVADVLRKGAAGAVVERNGLDSAAVVRVPDSLKALQALAAWARERWGGQVIGITGSAGKTTTKDIVAQVLSVEFATGKTEGNLNNHVGVPLSILRLPESARLAVLEMGMNHPGEIRRLAAIARPQVGVVTNVGLAHAEFFNSADEVALAKRELIEALPPDGVAVLNADDPRVSRFREAHRGCVVSFGFEESADVRPERVDYRPEGVRFVVDGVEFESVLVGRHGVMNVLAGIAVARVFGIPAGRLVDAVRAVEPGQMRGRRLVRRGITIFDDCYNSNPEAVRSMLDVLRQAPARRRIAVLGEMLELGRFAEPLHRDVGRYVAACGMNVLVGIRGAARHLVEEAVRSGMPAGAAFFFEDPAAAGVFLRRALQEGDAVLFKGSRGTQVEKALEGVVE